MKESGDNNKSMAVAIDQIENALSRIESAFAKIRTKPHATSQNDMLETQLAEIKSRHASLRSAAEQAIRQIDRLSAEES